MTNIVRFDDFEDAEIRVTDDGRYSVFDVIRFCSKTKGGAERKVLSRLCEQYSEVVSKLTQHKFEGRGQRETPVATRVDTVYIIGLLSGEAGQAYREEAAKIFLQYLDASPELAESIIDRATPEDLQRIELRLKTKKVRISFASVLEDHGVTLGWQFGQCTDAVYRPLLGGACKKIKADRGLAKKDNLRDSLDEFELSQVMFAEALASKVIKGEDLQGYSSCYRAAKEAATKVKSIS